MKQFTNVFERIDRLQEAEGFFVAREVGNYLYLMLPESFEEADEAIATCQDWFVHLNVRHHTPPEIADEIAKVYYNALRNLDKREKLARGIVIRIAEARSQFREYLPYVVRML